MAAVFNLEIASGAWVCEFILATVDVGFLRLRAELLLALWLRRLQDVDWGATLAVVAHETAVVVLYDGNAI